MTEPIFDGSYHPVHRYKFFVKWHNRLAYMYVYDVDVELVHSLFITVNTYRVFFLYMPAV